MSIFLTRWKRFSRTWRAAIILLVVGLFAGTSTPEPRPGTQAPARVPGKKPPPSGSAQQVQLESPHFRYTHIQGGKRAFDIIAKKAEILKNEDFSLLGVEDITLYGSNGKESHLTSDFGRWIKASGDFEVWGNVVGRIPMRDNGGEGGLKIETFKLIYKEKWQAILTQRRVKLTTERVQITGIGMNFDIPGQKAKLMKAVWTKLKIDQTDVQVPLEIRSNRLDLDVEVKRAVYTQKPRLSLGRNRLTGSKMVLDLGGDDEKLAIEGPVKGIFFRGALSRPAVQHQRQEPTASPMKVQSDKASFHRGSATALFEGHVKAKWDKRRMDCDRLTLLFDAESNRLQIALATGKVRVFLEDGIARGGRLLYDYRIERGLLSRTPSLQRPKETLTARLIYFHGDGMIVAEGKVRLRRKKDRSSQKRQAKNSKNEPLEVRAGRSVYLPDGKLRFMGKVKVLRGSSTLKAEEVELLSNEQGEFTDLWATGTVRLSEADRIAMGDSIEYSFGGGQAVLLGAPARAWLDDDYIEAAALTFSRKAGDVTAEKDVVLRMERRGKEAAGLGVSDRMSGPIAATCQQAIFSEGRSRLDLSGDVEVILKNEQLRLRCQRLELYVDEDQRLSRLEAWKDVVIQQETSEVKGSHAKYERARQHLVITGTPVQMRREGGTSEGDKASLDLATRQLKLFGERAQTILQSP